MPRSEYRVALVTAPNPVLAEKLAKGLVENKLAACVNVIPGLVSHYYWEGKPQKDSELLLVIKTRAGLMPRLIAFVKKNHGAAVPEIVSLPIMEGNADYLRWLGTSVSPARP